MKDYKLKSLEELRFEDYSANRKTATTQSTFGSTASTGLFGSSTTPAATTPSGFGGSNLFGGSTAAQSTANRPLLFGGSTTTASPTSTSLFGQTAQPATAQRSFFGQTAAPAAVTTTGFGGFGAAAQPAATTSVFGGAQQSSSIFGGLGQTSTAAVATPSTGLFGSTTATTAATTGGIFGQQAAKPAFGGFGATTAAPAPQQSSPFSFNAQPAVATTATPSIFGQTAANTSLTAKPAGFGGFGASTTGFGAAAQPAATGGIFGSTTVKPAFGAATTQPATTGFGGFGATAQPATGGGIFGGFGLATAQPQVAVSPFGAAQPATGGFGSTFGQTQQATTGGLFGATAQAQPAAAATIGGIFGGGQTAGGFGSGLTGGFGATTGTTLGGTTGATGGIFGSTAAQPQATSQFNLGGAPGGSFLTGNTSLTGGFGSGLTGTTQNTSGFGGLNTSQQQLQQQQGLQQQKLCQSYQDQPLVQQQISALSNSPYGSTYHLMKKEEIFNPVSPLAQRQYITDATSPVKLTSILSTGITSDVKGGLSQSIKITPKPLSTISLNKKTDLFEGLEDEEAPCFYPRKNIKKLLFKPTCQNISNTSGRSSPSNSITGGDHKIDFMRKSTYQIENENVGLGRFNQTNDYSTNNYNQGQPDSTNISEDGHINGGDSHSEGSNQPGMIQHPANIILERPGYFTIPSMQELASMTDKNGDCLVENFSIGRVDYGCITFPMVTNIANMNLDEIVHIRRKEVHVYPDETKKPPQGQGLNKTAEVTLHRIWPTDKETKKPTTDPNRIINMGYNKKIEKATVEMGAQFIDYDPTTGSWTFKVKHFSKYGLHDSDDDDDTMGGGVELVGIHSTHNPIKACNAASNFLTKEHGAMNQGNEMDIKQEKDMIQRQLKLIETRRLDII